MWGPRIPFLLVFSVSNILRLIKKYVRISMTLFVVDLNINQHTCVNLDTLKIVLIFFIPCIFYI